MNYDDDDDDGQLNDRRHGSRRLRDAAHRYRHPAKQSASARWNKKKTLTTEGPIVVSRSERVLLNLLPLVGHVINGSRKEIYSR